MLNYILDFSTVGSSSLTDPMKSNARTSSQLRTLLVMPVRESLQESEVQYLLFPLRTSIRTQLTLSRAQSIRKMKKANHYPSIFKPIISLSLRLIFNQLIQSKKKQENLSRNL